MFTNWDCPHDAFGCLYDAELRPFCDIQDFTEQSTCNMAGNPEDPNADEGMDPDTTGGGGIVDPFGDVSELISCFLQTTCTIENELRYNVEYNFHLFHEEGVLFTLGTYGTGVTDFKVSGLSTGEDSKEVFDALSFINGDVVTHVNSVALDSWADVADVMEDIDALNSWSITVKRKLSGVWRTRNYTITIVSTISAPPPMPEARSPGSGDGADDGGAASSCACQTTDSTPTTAGLVSLMLGGLLARRRR